jgi:hypothetical protein
MEKEFIPYEQALALKELGFNEPCFGFYSELGSFNFEFNKTNSNCNKPGMHGKYCTAPTYSQTFRWFRDKHELNSEIYMNHEYGIKIYTYLVLKLEKSIISHKSGYAVKQNIYEESELACLRKLIEIVKNEG